MFKRIATFACLLAMLTLSACGGTPSANNATSGNAATEAPKTETTATEAPKEETAPAEETSELAPYQIDYVMLSNSPTEDVVKIEEAINKIIQPKINATIKFKMVDWASWDEKANMPVQAGEKADIIFTADWYNYMRSISQGMFLKLNDPAGDYGDLLNTYGKEAVAGLGDAFIKGAQVDGFNYGVPTNKELTVPGGFVFNKTLLDKYNLNMDDIKTQKDLEPWFQIVKDGEGKDFYPLLTDGAWDSPYIDVASGVSEAIMYNDAKPDGTDDPNIYYIWDQPDVLDHMKDMRKWYEAGYIHPDSYLTTYSTTDMFNAGKWLVQNMPLKGSTAKSDELMAASGNAELKVVEKQTQQARQITVHAGGSMLAIPVTSQDPARAMMFINLMHSDPELLNTMVWGIEGENYTKVSESVVKVNQDNNWNSKHAGNWTLGNQFLQWTSDNENPDKFKLLKEFSATGTPHISLGFRYRQDDVVNELAAIKDLKDAVERSIKCGAVDPETEIPKLVEAEKAAGMDKVMEDVRKQFTDWLAKK